MWCWSAAGREHGKTFRNHKKKLQLIRKSPGIWSTLLLSGKQFLSSSDRSDWAWSSPNLFNGCQPFPGIKWLEREANLWTVYSTYVKNEWSHTSSPPVCLHGMYMVVYRFLCYSSWWRNWLRHCATNQKVAGSISNCVIGIFHWFNPGRIMALGLTQPLTKLSSRNISWGGGG